MPLIHSRKISLAFDMNGCPNQCKHCWLGELPNKKISVDKVREVTNKFKVYKNRDEVENFFRNINIFTWMREPHYGKNYKELYKLEKELSSEDIEPFELTSIWRLCNDDKYVEWGKEIGIKKCQISFFGMEENTNYIVGRKTAFEENLKATELLIDNYIAPRWQVFLTKDSILDLKKLEELIKSHQIEEKLKSRGMKFECFLQNPTPDGNAFNLDDKRVTKSDLTKIPEYFLDKTKEVLNIDNLENYFGKTERELNQELKNYNEYPNLYNDLCFYITGNLDVFSNFAELMPWWKLGNIEIDSIDKIMDNFEKNKNFGLHMNYNVRISKLVKKYGELSDKLYTKDDLILKYMRMHGEEYWKSK